MPVKPYPMYYDYEAEVLAQFIRKDSSVDTAWKKIKEVVDKKLKLEKKTYRVDEDTTTPGGERTIVACECGYVHDVDINF